MVSRARWEEAQRYERSYWDQQAFEIGEGRISQLDWYEWRANRLRERLRRVGLGALAEGNGRILEIGCGPVGVISFLGSAQSFAVDPLEPFFGSNEVLRELRSEDVEYLPGTGEALPFPDGGFDFVISENCIDHVRAVDVMMREITRVLTPAGILYMTVNARTRWGAMLHRVLSSGRIDRGHPHTFTSDRVTRLLRRHGFSLLSVDVEDYREARRADLRSSSVKPKVKGALGLSEFVVSVLAQAES